MDKLVCAIFDDNEHAERAVNRLLEDGIDRELVSILVHDQHVEHEDVEHAGTKSGTRMAQGGMIGGAAGALLGGLVLGPIGLVGVGPLAAAAFGATGGGLYGAVAGALTGRDTTKDVVKDLAARVEQGEVLVTAEVEGKAKAEEIANRLSHLGASPVVVA